MRTFLVPHKTGAHRVAAIALYRAILAQSRLVSLPHQARDELQHLVRNRFRQAQHVHGIRRLKFAFEAGYEALDRLDAAVAGHEASRAYILSLLERAPTRAKQAPDVICDRQHANQTRCHREDGQRSQSSLQQRFQRPLALEQLSGKRHVPVLVNANRIPVLRLKKPQPESLSRLLRDRVKQRQSRHDRRHMLGDLLKLARQEDIWDGICSTTLKDGTAIVFGDNAVGREPMWTAEIKEALSEVQSALDQENRKNMATASKMQAVVDAEKEACEREREERMRVKKAANRVKRNEARKLEKAAISTA